MLAIDAKPGNLNLDKDLEDIQSTMRKVAWSEEEKAARLWEQLEGDDQQASFCQDLKKCQQRAWTRITES